jgi:hypothetical protein
MEVVLVVAALLVVLWVAVRWSRREPPSRSGPRPASPTVLDAARRGDVELLADLVRAGADVNAIGADRNTALHLAYYENRPAAVAWLIGHGAEQQWRNRHGFTPAEMRRFGEVVRLVRRGADALTAVGSVHKPIGTSLRNELRAVPVELYLAAVERLATVDPAKRRVVFLAIKLGIPGTEDLLCDLLRRSGDRPAAEVYLNAGSPPLRACALQWAATHGFDIVDGRGDHHVTWGVL